MSSCLAILTLLLAVLHAVVAPQSAAAAGTLSSASWSASSTQTSSSGVSYTYVFTVASSQSFTKFTMTVPPGTSGTPSVTSLSAISAASGGYSIAMTAGTPTLSGTTLTLPVTATKGGGPYLPGGAIVTAVVGGLTNTATSGSYTSTIAWLNGTTTVDSGTSNAVVFTSSALTRTYWTQSSLVASATGVAVSADFTTSSTASLSSVALTLPAIAGGTPSLTSVSGLPSGGTVTRSGSTLTYSFTATNVASGTAVSLLIGGLTNAAVPASYTGELVTYNGSTAIDSGAVGSLTITTSAFAAVSWSTSSTTTAATAVEYDYTLTATTSKTDDKIVLSVPPGTAGTPVVASMVLNGSSVTATAALSGTALTLSFTGTWFPQGSSAAIHITGLTNTSTAGSFAAMATSYSTDSGNPSVDAGSSAALVFTAASAQLGSATWSVSSTTSSASGVSYTFSFTVPTTLTASSVTMTVPSGTAGTVGVGTVAPSSISGGTASLSGQTLTYSFPAASVASGTLVSIKLTGITNPSAQTASSAITLYNGATVVGSGTTGSISFTSGALTGVSWSASSPSTGATSVSYSYGFTTGSSADLTKATFTVPAGTTATSLSVTSMTANPGYTGYTITVNSVNLSGTTLTVAFTSSAQSGYVPANTVFALTVAGFTNTSTANTYSSAVTTYAGVSAVDSGTSTSVTFTPPAAALGSVTWSLSQSKTGATGVTYTLSFQMPTAATLTEIDMTVPSGTTGTPGISAVTPSTISGGTASLSGTTLSYLVSAGTLSSGATVTVHFTGLTNTTVLQTVSSDVVVYNGSTAVGSGTSNSVTYTSAGLGSLSWSADNSTTSAPNVNYTFGFTAGSSSDLNKITMAVPSGASGTPALLSLQASGFSSSPFTNFAVSLSSGLLTVTFDAAWFPAGTAFTIVVSGMTNPSTAGSYALQIITYNTAGAGAIDSGTTSAFALTSATLTGLSWSSSNTVVNTQSVTYTYSFGMSVAATLDSVSMSVPAGTAGSPTVGAVTPSSIAGGTVTLSGGVLTYSFPNAASIGTAATVSISIGGLTNTATATSYTSQILALDGGQTIASGTSPAVTFAAASLTNPSWAASSSSTSVASTYTYGLTTSAATLTSVTMTVPGGTTGTPALGTVSGHDQYGAVTLTNAQVARSGTTLTVTFTAQYMRQGTVLSLEITGLTNTTSPGSYSSTISTFNGTTGVASATTPALSFSAITVGTASWTASSAAVSATGVTYTYSFTLSAAATVDWLTLTLPQGTGGTLQLGTVTPAAIAGGTLSVNGQTLTYTFPAAAQLDTSTAVSLSVTGVKNTPTAGTYSSTVTLYDASSTIIASGTTTSVTLSSSVLSSVTWSTSSSLTSATGVQYTWGFKTATSNQLNSITITVPQGTGGTPTLVSATAAGVTLTNLSVALSGSVLTLSFTSVTMPSGTSIGVQVSGLTNTSIAGSYSSSITTTYSSSPRDSGVTPTLTLQHSQTGTLSWSIGNNVAGATNLTYSFSLTTATSASLTGITVALPGGTSGSPVLTSLTVGGTDKTSGASVALQSSSGTLAVNLAAATSVAAGATIAFQVSGMTNTQAVGSYSATASTLTSGAAVDTAVSAAISIAAQSLVLSSSCVAATGCLASAGSTALTLIAIPGAAAPVFGSVQLGVQTNSPHGYVVLAQSTALLNAHGDQLPQAALTGSASVQVNQFGAAANLQGSGSSGATLCAPYGGSVAQVGYDTAASVPVWAADAATGSGTDSVTLRNSVQVSATQPAGEYTGTISYTVQPRYVSGSGC